MLMKFHSLQTKKYIFTNVGMVKKLHDPDLSKQLQKIKIINKWSNGNTLNYIKQAELTQNNKILQAHII